MLQILDRPIPPESEPRYTRSSFTYVEFARLREARPRLQAWNGT
jgi:hypothetical protein